jgi:hypothetical protein
MNSHENNTKSDVVVVNERRVWTTPELNQVGTVSEVLRAGGGKLSMAGDPGDMRKNTGGG